MYILSYICKALASNNLQGNITLFNNPTTLIYNLPQNINHSFVEDYNENLIRSYLYKSTTDDIYEISDKILLNFYNFMQPFIDFEFMDDNRIFPEKNSFIKASALKIFIQVTLKDSYKFENSVSKLLHNKYSRFSENYSEGSSLNVDDVSGSTYALFIKGTLRKSIIKKVEEYFKGIYAVCSKESISNYKIKNVSKNILYDHEKLNENIASITSLEEIIKFVEMDVISIIEEMTTWLLMHVLGAYTGSCNKEDCNDNLNIQQEMIKIGSRVDYEINKRFSLISKEIAINNIEILTNFQSRFFCTKQKDCSYLFLKESNKEEIMNKIDMKGMEIQAAKFFEYIKGHVKDAKLLNELQTALRLCEGTLRSLYYDNSKDLQYRNIIYSQLKDNDQSEKLYYDEEVQIKKERFTNVIVENAIVNYNLANINIVNIEMVYIRIMRYINENQKTPKLASFMLFFGSVFEELRKKEISNMRRVIENKDRSFKNSENMDISEHINIVNYCDQCIKINKKA